MKMALAFGLLLQTNTRAYINVICHVCRHLSQAFYAFNHVSLFLFAFIEFCVSKCLSANAILDTPSQP